MMDDSILIYNLHDPGHFAEMQFVTGPFLYIGKNNLTCS